MKKNKYRSKPKIHKRVGESKFCNMKKLTALLAIFAVLFYSNLFAGMHEHLIQDNLNAASTNNEITETSLNMLENSNRENKLLISFGLGASYAGLGARAQYFLGNKTAIQGGVGYVPSHGGWVLITGGVKLYHPDKNYYFNLQLGGVGSYYDRDANPTEGRAIGTSFLFGYDWFFSEKIGINIAGGGTYIFTGIQTIVPSFDLGLIIKL